MHEVLDQILEAPSQKEAQFPNRESAYRLVGVLCAEMYEEWSTGRRYLNMDEYLE